MVTTLKRWPELGLKPVALLRGGDEPYGQFDGVPVLGSPDLAPHLAKKHRIPYAIVAMPDLSHRELVIKLGSFSKFFKHVFVAADSPGVHSLWDRCATSCGLNRLQDRALCI